MIHKRRFLSLMIGCMAFMTMTAQDTFKSSTVADEGAWCWFADPRALHYENAEGNIKMTYIGYIDVHGNIKATQYDWIAGRKTDVLVRSYFQPDDHNNPTFLVLPDERVLIIYSRHTDEPAFYYRISRKPGDITALGDEKKIVTANNTTYPSPFILSDDPTHWYLCWRGINWHPTIARLTLPDENDEVSFDFGPKQIVQSTGARPYCKYQSNGKDKIYLAYTTGHPDNEMPDWLYCNYIDINKGNGPILNDLNGNQLKKIADGVFNVNKTDSYANSYPATIVDKTANIRNWVWQIALDDDEHPVIAYPHIDNEKTTHVYWYARWNGAAWKNTWVAYAGHAFHQNWNSTERCYSGGMSIDPDHINDLYLSIPTTDGQYDKDGVYELWKYTINDDGSVAGAEQLTSHSAKNNARPYVIPGSKNSPMRLGWMNGDYYYWMVKQGYPKGYPTSIQSDYEWHEELTQESEEERTDDICFGKNKTLTLGISMYKPNYASSVFSIDNLSYRIDDDYYPVVTIGNQNYRSSNRLLTSDDWATQSSGTSGDNHPTKLDTWVLSMTYDGQTLTTYRNGLVDQVIETTADLTGVLNYHDGMNNTPIRYADYYACASPMTVQKLVAEMQNQLYRYALNDFFLPTEICADLVLPSSSRGYDLQWKSDNPSVISDTGVLFATTEDTPVTLTASIGNESKACVVTALARDISKNLRYQLPEPLNLKSNTATGFQTNKFGLAPEKLLQGLRSYTFLLKVNAKTMLKQPRLYDFGSGSGNSLFLRADALSAGIKYNGGTTTMVNSTTTLQPGVDYLLAVSYDAATHTTTIYINGVEDASGTANQVEAYQLYQVAKDTRNYIGRTQWWDGSYAADNQDFCGTISDFRLYDVCLTRKEICELQGIPFEQPTLPTELSNGDFEGSYSVMSGSGVSADRAIYVPEGWTVDRANGDPNDLTALKDGDKYFSNFFADKPSPSADSRQTYWIRQNWGTPTLTLSQELALPAGTYTLTCDLWKSGLGGDAIVSVTSKNGVTVQSPTLENMTEWQQVSIPFESDGEASTTVRLAAIHTAAGSEKIIGFDNVMLTKDEETSVDEIGKNNVSDLIYDLSGRHILRPAKPGIYISNGSKVIINE